MPKNTTGKVSTGDPFVSPGAENWNNMIDAGEDFANRRHNREARPPIRPRETDMIRIQNDCGADRRRGEILEISGKAITDVTDEHKWLKGVEPAGGFFGILKDPVLDQSVVRMQTTGTCIALVDITDLAHTHADQVVGEYVLGSAGTGPLEILYAPAALGEQEAVVRFTGEAGAVIIFFKPLEIPAGIGSACDAVTAEVLEASCGSGYSEGDEVTVWSFSKEQLAMPSTLLFGDATTEAARGKAVLMKTPQSIIDDYSSILDVGPCIFRATKIFCTEGDET